MDHPVDVPDILQIPAIPSGYIQDRDAIILPKGYKKYVRIELVLLPVVGAWLTAILDPIQSYKFPGGSPLFEQGESPGGGKVEGPLTGASISCQGLP